MLTTATEHYARQQRITAAGLLATKRARKRGLVAAVQALAAFQLLAARDAANSVPLMLEEQDIDPRPVAEPNLAPLIGVASNGVPMGRLLDQAETDYRFGLMVVTQLQDVARTAAGMGLAVRPRVTGYTRMLNPPSCSRCAVLAGKFFRWNAGFERHPRCDCRHVPTTEARSDDLTTDPDSYFASLSGSEQDRIFTKAGAQAIRDGADVAQVVNARKGMFTAQVGGRNVLVSTEGTTRRGLASRRRTGRNMSARLMPESIYSAARSRDEALRMLRLHGYIL